MKVMIISCVIDVVFVLSLFERAISSAGSLSTVDAKVMPQYDNLILNETADQIMTNTTPLYCANTCLTDPYCMSYFYNVLTKVCKVFHNDFIDTSKAIAENGWRYFHVLRDCKIHGRVCPPTYTYVEHICFCYKYFQIQSDCEAANEYCKNEGGYLAKLDRMKKHIEMEKLLLTVPDPELPNGDIYIQGTRDESDDSWWFDNGLRMKFFVWNREHPILYQPELRDGETALIIQKFFFSKWHDAFTNNSIMFVCEIPL